MEVLFPQRKCCHGCRYFVTTTRGSWRSCVEEKAFALPCIAVPAGCGDLLHMNAQYWQRHAMDQMRYTAQRISHPWSYMGPVTVLQSNCRCYPLCG